MLRKFLRDEKGAVAVEMALIGPMFLLLLLSVVELGLMLFSQSVLDGAARDAARLVRTGQVQAAGSTTAQIAAFQNKLCGDLAALLTASNCASNVIFDVETFATFTAVTFTHTPACTSNAGSGSGVPCPFTPGNTGQIVGVRVQYQRAYLIPWVSACLSGGSCWYGLGSSAPSGGTGKATLSSTVVFQNEP
jgi:Flp pilus assembly protein TadG